MAPRMGGGKVNVVTNYADTAGHARTLWRRCWMWIGLISLLFLHGCAVARSLHTAAVNGGAKDTETMDVQEVLRRGESYYHYLLSYAFQLRNDLEEHLVQAIGEMQEALK